MTFRVGGGRTALRARSSTSSAPRGASGRQTVTAYSCSSWSLWTGRAWRRGPGRARRRSRYAARSPRALRRDQAALDVAPLSRPSHRTVRRRGTSTHRLAVVQAAQWSADVDLARRAGSAIRSWASMILPRVSAVIRRTASATMPIECLLFIGTVGEDDGFWPSGCRADPSHAVSPTRVSQAAAGAATAMMNLRHGQDESAGVVVNVNEPKKTSPSPARLTSSRASARRRARFDDLVGIGEAGEVRGGSGRHAELVPATRRAEARSRRRPPGAAREENVVVIWSPGPKRPGDAGAGREARQSRGSATGFPWSV